MVFTFSSSMSAPSLCSALAMADSRAFLTMPAAFFCVNARMLSAWSTFLPRIRSATSRPLSTDRRTPRTIARVSMVCPYFLAFLSPGWPLNVRVSENSPSLCPTIWSVMYTGTCCLPLCTAMVRPMKSGRIMERRDQVFTGFLSLVATAFSTLAIRWWSTKGPFFRERAISAYLLLLATRDNECLRALVVAGAVALGRGVPRRHRDLTFTSTAFTTTVRVVDRVHGGTTDGRADALPADGAGLAVLTQAVLFVAHFTDGGAAVDVDPADLTGTQADLGVD